MVCVSSRCMQYLVTVVKQICTCVVRNCQASTAGRGKWLSPTPTFSQISA